MKRTSICLLLVGLWVCSAAGTGCAALKAMFAPEPTTGTWMVSSEFVGEHSAAYLIDAEQRTDMAGAAEAMAKGADEASDVPVIHHFEVEICDLESGDSGGTTTNCEKSTVLEQVVRADEKGGGQGSSMTSKRRRVTSIYWYDARTLYVAFTQARNAKMLRCRLQSDNSLTCQRDGNIHSTM